MNINDVKTAIRILMLPSFIKLELIYNFAAWIVKRGWHARLARGSRAARPCHSSQHNSPVALAPRHALAIEILEQWNRVLARDAGKILECRHVNRSIRTLPSIFTQLLRQLIQRGAMKEHLAVHLHQHTGIDQ